VRVGYWRAKAVRAAVGCRSLDATTMTTSTFQSWTCEQTKRPQTFTQTLPSFTFTSAPDRLPQLRIHQTHHITHHGTNPSNQRAGTFPRSVKVGHISSRRRRSSHSSYLGHSHLRLWRIASDAKHAESARRRPIQQLLHPTRAIRLGHMGRIPRCLFPHLCPSLNIAKD
jgi:hypothetical protein